MRYGRVQFDLLVDAASVATGCCQTPARIIKDLCEVIKEDLRDLINLSYSTNTFPKALKHAWIRAIFKNKGNKNEPEYYRPISILPVISKLFERSATKQLVKYLETNNELYEGQHAYRRCHSTTTCLVEITEAIHREVDNGGVMGIASMDLSKAFDSVSHGLLLKKLEQKGLSGRCLKWLKSYLTERTQQVRFKDFTSSKTVVQSGVPQGSVLGPILFISLTSDLVNHLDNECIVKAYADDTQLLVRGRHREEVKLKLQSVIAKAQAWFTGNSLLINPTKTEIMMVGKKSKGDEDITIDVKEGNSIIPLKLASQIKILGVIVDEDLSWKKQVHQVRKRATNIVRNLARTSGTLPKKTKRILYDSLAAPHFSYADVVWDGCLQKQRKELQRIHNFAARSITGAKKFSSATDALKTLGMIPLAQKRQVHQAVLVHKLVNGNGPKELCSVFKNVKSASGLPEEELRLAKRLRSSKNMMIPPKQHRTSKFERSSIHRMTKVWNGLPLNCKLLQDSATFKRTVQRVLTHAYWGPSVSTRRP